MKGALIAGMIKSLSISNFKTFNNTEVGLRGFNALIGANASGKSNFVHIFQFLRDLVKYNLGDAISMQGGVEYLRNVRLGPSNHFSLTVSYDPMLRMRRRKSKGTIHVESNDATYHIELGFKKKGQGFDILDESLSQRYEFYEAPNIKRQGTVQKNGEEDLRRKMGEAALSLKRVSRRVRCVYDYPRDQGTPPIDERELLPFSSYLKHYALKPREAFLGIPFLNPFLRIPFDRISIYDFDPRLSKKAVHVTGSTRLEEDGSNLSIVLKRILENKNNKRKLFNLTKDLLPFVNTMRVERLIDKSFVFRLQETYSQDRSLPAQLVSDGTLNIIALITAIYFERERTIIIEEPERNIHPSLLSRVVSMLKDASEKSKKQIVVTTHNPEIVRYTDPADILLVNRDHDGFSNIVRPSDRSDIKTFLTSEMGIQELFVQGLLGG
jgi:predicted ATPase